MIKCLILAYDFPPYTSMGAQRPYSWFSYFKEYNIEPTVITRQWPSKIQSKVDYSRSVGNKTIITNSDKGRILAVPYKANFRDRLLIRFGFDRYSSIRRGLTFLQSVLQYISSFFDNKSPIYKQAKKLLKEEYFDIIIATGEPFVLFRYAYLLNKEFKVHWIADYRDCWSDNFEINRLGGINKFLHKFFFRCVEKKYVSSAKAITTVAPFFEKQINLLFPTNQIHTIFNGYIPEMFDVDEYSYQGNTCFTVAFAGTIYPFQPIELFLEGLNLFIEQNASCKIKVIFYGANYYKDQKARILRYSTALCNCIETTDRISQTTLFKELKKADILLLLDNKGMISGKLYEYLALNKYILMAGNDFGSMSSIIEVTNSGVICADERDVMNQLKRIYHEWQQTGQVKCNSRNIEQYSRKEQTKKLAELFNKLTNGES